METIAAFTLDSVSKAKAAANLCSEINSRKVMARVVLDEDAAPGDYLTPISRLRTAGVPVMAEMLDSYYVGRFTAEEARARCGRFFDALASYVNLWEVANEINGEWLGRPDDVIRKALDAQSICKSRGAQTAVTLYYNPKCWERKDNEMWSWAQRYVVGSGLNPNYILLSYYEQDCERQRFTVTQWTAVFRRLATMFPGSAVGFGEMGAPRRATLAGKQEVMNRYYRMTPAIQKEVPSYIGGYFWWYGAQDLFTRTGAGPLWPTYKAWAE